METIKMKGKIIFAPNNKTKKHILHDSRKKVAMVMFYGDVCEYYKWFLKKRYSLILTTPLRGGHISFINDYLRDMKVDNIDETWTSLKQKYHHKDIEVEIDLNPKTNGLHWWFDLTQDSKDNLQEIRNELGLDLPYYPLHFSIGYSNEKNIAHSKYIQEVIK